MKYHGDVLAGAFSLRWQLRRAAYLFALCLVMTGQLLQLSAQARGTATPALGVLVTPTPEGRESVTATLAPTVSPTPLPAVRLRALDTAGNVNIRALPSLDGEILGTIAAGVEYQVLRNYYRWYEFRYDLSPNGRGWIYGDLVEIVGDRSQIEIVDNPADIAAPRQLQNSDDSADSEEAERTIAISTLQANSDVSVELGEVTVLPTFTPPAATPVSVTEQLELETSEPVPWADLPPILPVAALAGLGILGFLINALRR